MLMHLPIVIAAALPVSPVADTLPQLDVARECRAEIGNQTDEQRCVADDNQARDELKKEWSSFNASERRLCERETAMGGASSYAELLTCLEMSRETRGGRPVQRAESDDAQDHATTGQAGPPRSRAKNAK